MGSAMMRPEGSAIRPRMPANWRMGWKPPLVAPEFTMMPSELYGSSSRATASVTSSVASVHSSTVLT